MNKETQKRFDDAYDYADRQHPGGRDINWVGQCQNYCGDLNVCDCLNAKWTRAYFLYHKFPKETDLLLDE